MPACSITCSPSCAVCQGGTVTLTEDGGNAVSWSWSTGEATQSIDVTTSGTYSVTVTDTNGCESTCQKEVTVNPNPTVSVGDVTVCDGETATLTADTSGSPCTVTSYQWYQGSSVSGGTIISDATSSTYQTTQAGDYTCEVACANGCKAEDYGTVTVRDCTTPVIVEVTQSSDEPCAGEDVVITAHVTDDIGVTSVTLTYDGTTIPMSLVSGSATDGNWEATIPGQPACTTLSLYVTASDGVNTVSSTPHEKHWMEGPTADAGPDRTIYYGDSVEIGGDPTASGGTPSYTYSWTPTTGLDDPTIANPTASPNSTTTYTVLVTDDNGCSDSDSMRVTVRSRPVGGPGGFAADECYLRIDMLGEIYRVEMSCCRNRSLEDCRALDPDELHFMEIEEGMEIICGDCTGCRCYPKVVVMSLAEEAPPVPDGIAIVGPVYDFTGYKDTMRYVVCHTATFFDPPITVLLSYDPDELPEGAFSPVIAYYDTELGLWVELPPDTGRVAEVGKVTGLAERFASPFAVLVNVPPPPPPPPPPTPAPAHFVASSLNIAPSVREIWQPVTFVTLTGESVTITANVANDGGQEGSYLVELKINGETIDKKEITLGAGQSEQVSFTLSGMEPGQYEVAVSGLSGEFTVLRTINWWLIGGIVAALILLGWLVWYRKRRIRPEPVS